MSDVIVIGGGQAGASLVARLRSKGHDGAITLICAEPVPPYQRPPLSKAYLLGEMEEHRLYLRPAAFYADNDITLRLNAPVTAIDAAGKTVSVGGDTLRYDTLVLATGSRPRRLPAAIGGDLDGVYQVRTLADVDAMAAEFRPGRRLLVVGGGYIGLEAAAVASKLGLEVTVVEMAERILQRVACAETSDYFRATHARHGVSICEETGLGRLTGDGHVDGALLADGRRLEIDFAIVGVGITPDSALAASAGLPVDNGIIVNAYGQTSDPDVFAAGDCAIFPFRDRMMRLESVQNAIDQAECVADNIVGIERAYDPKPWFWSDQYDVKLQIAGLNLGYDRVIARQGTAEGAVSFWYYCADRLLAVDAMNDARAYMIGKRLIEGGKSPAPAVIADPATDMKALLRG